MTRQKKRGETAQSVERAFSLLDTLRDSGHPMSVGDIAHALDMSTTTVHRLLTTLNTCGVVAQEPHTRRYFLALKMLLFGKAILDRFEWRSRAHPLLGELSRQVGETVFMGVLDHYDLVYIDHVDSLDHTLRMTPQIGRRQDAHTTALGKVLLAHASPEEVEPFLNRKDLPRRTPNSITNSKALKSELEKIRERGYAFDLQESEIGICCVAAPIRGLSDQVVAAISVSGPSARIEMKGMDSELKKRLLETAARISEIAVF
jgi:IclR family acetate operon transcriptional repressor